MNNLAGILMRFREEKVGITYVNDPYSICEFTY